MKILYLYSNHKWTGPAELALQQVLALNRLPGMEAELALAGHHDPELPHAIEARAGELGVPVRRGLALRRHFHLRSHLNDARQLAAWLKAGNYDLVHCHQSGDHLVAALALARVKIEIPLVRSYWENTPPRRGPRSWFCFRRTDRVIAAFERQARELNKRLKSGSPRIAVHPPILGEVKAPDDRTGQRQRLRDELKLGSNAYLIGLTARIQPNRRWDLCWRIMQQLANRYPDIHLCILGRPDEGVFDKLCARPLTQMGLSHCVHFLGYRQGQSYFDALAAFDAFLFLVPGSDGTCRALREAMAMGLPAVTADSGYLSEIVHDQVTGYTRPLDPEALAVSLGRLHDEPGLRESLGRAASRYAVQHWSGAGPASKLIECYEALTAPRMQSPNRP